MTSIPAPRPLKMYLVCYGSENEFWVCDAEDRDHAVEQFENADVEGEINDVFECVPATNRYFVRQRQAMWVCFVQEVEAESREAALDIFHDDFMPQHSFVEDRVAHGGEGPVAVFDRWDFPTAAEVADVD